MSKKLTSWVRPGVLLTRARFFCSHNMLRSEDFPTLERPTMATSGHSLLGNCFLAAALVENFVLR